MTSSGPPTSYLIAPFRLEEHLDALTRLWSDSMSDAGIASVVPERMRWLYQDAPNGAPETLVCRIEATGEIVGCASYLPRNVRVGGRTVKAGLLCDFAVSRRHRVLGPAVGLQRGLVEAARAAGIQLLYGHPNSKSLPVFQRIGFRAVGSASRWSKPLRSATKLRAMLGGEVVARVAAWPVDLGLAGVDALRLLTAGVARGRLADAPPAGAGALWERFSAQHPISGERTAEYLDWRYARFPTARHRFFEVEAGQGGALAALAIVSLRGTTALLQDLIVDAAAVRPAAVLLALGRALRREGADVITSNYIGDPAFTAELRAAGFLRRPGERPLVVHPDLVPAERRAEALDPASWFLLDGELDI